MHNWSTLKDVKYTLIKQWKKGWFFLAESSQLFPLKIKLKAPTSKQLSEQFSTCQQWVRQITGQPSYQIEWRDINHQKLGKNRLPVAIVFDTLEEVLEVIGKTRDYQQFRQLSDQLLTALPELSGWLARYPFRALKYEKNWSPLIRATHWMLNHPQPNIYIRQIRLSEIDTKLLERHKGLLKQWWDIVLPQQAINSQFTGIKQFEQRYGFKAKPYLFRFRILDPALYIHGLSDLSISATEFVQLKLNINTIFVTENDINGLAFPDHPKAIVLFGRGYGFEQLHQLGWLEYRNIYYWGDIDTHGFAILSQFRRIFPQTQSLLMDEQTLMNQRNQWVTEPSQSQADLNCLTDEEQHLYNKLRDNRIQKNLRLEQEFINYSVLTRKLDELQAGKRSSQDRLHSQTHSGC